MKQSATMIFHHDYFAFKKNFINANYEISNYVSLFPVKEEHISQTGEKILNIKDLINIDLKNDKVILAVPIDLYIKNIVQLLFKLGVNKDNIILLFREPSYYFSEDICLFRDDIDYAVDASGEIICKIGNNRFFLDTNDSLGVLREIYGQLCYNFFIPNNNITVVDIGMNIGVASIFFSQFENVKNIYSYEPFLPTFNRALENFKLNDFQNKISANPFGLSNNSRLLEVNYEENFRGSMSVIYDNPQLSPNNPLKRETVCVQDVAEVFTQIINENPESTFVFKVDCEGGEYDILNRLDETGLIAKIKMFLMEWHNFHDKNYSEIEAILRRHNFCYYRSRGGPINKVGMVYAWNPLPN